jgi:hypothetical protein
MVKTPVLFTPFARPEYARQTFDAIKKAKPEKLYFYSDKARKDNPEETVKNDLIRSWVKEIDWPCELKTYFREEHSGSVYVSVWDAFSWIFENEEQAIILEEDCVPSQAFFDFCDKLVPMFRDDKRIWVITGNNFIEDYNPHNYDYFFSYFPYMWGWASWRDRWKQVFTGDLPYDKIKEYRLFDQIYASRRAARQALRFTKSIIDTKSWDYRFQITMKCNGGFGIIPRVNLVSNIGMFGAHNKGNYSIFHNRKLPEYETYEIMNTPPFVVPDFGYSNHWYRSYYFKSRNIFCRLTRRLLKLAGKH